MIPNTGRGTLGRLERTPNVDLENYQDFCEGVRKYVYGPLNAPIMTEVEKAVGEAQAAGDKDLSDIDDLHAIFDPIPIMKTRNRVMRSVQEMTWRSLTDEYYGEGTKYAGELDAYDTRGPGTVEYNLDWEPPAYTRHPIHIQPGGYTEADLGGYVYYHGTNTFFEGMNTQDEAHTAIVQANEIPKDGKVERVLDIGCSIGQGAIALKERFADAEVHAIDVGAPMVRYAHKRAVDLGQEVHFAQRLAEDTKHPDNHFDVVNAFILFHEVPLEAQADILKEIFRVLRPGGIFNIFDFPHNMKDQRLPFMSYFIDVDSKDNCEPFSVDFTLCDFQQNLRDAGFNVWTGDDQIMIVKTVYAEKPA
jgi:ubiquinone/menaquinone biosynthesis C-methylase UbiE